MKKFKTNTNTFTIAHYILLFLVTGLCISILAWVMITRHTTTTINKPSPSITHITQNTPCVQRTIDTVKKLWEFNPRAIPQKYWEIAINYMNQPVSTTTYGICQDIAFTCRRGQVRYDCDPCAVPSARTYAQSIHIADLLKTNCPNE